MTIPKEQIQKVMEVLTEWNPLGPKASAISNLDNYRTEAIDILFNLELKKSNPAVIVQQVINQAFDLSLPVADCTSVGRKIQELIKKQKMV
jgi:hypothetical protein